FLMDGENVGPGAGEIAEVALRLDDHEVDVEGEGGRLADRLDDERTDCDIGDETAVHDVEVDRVRPRPLHLGYLLAEETEIGRKDGGENLHRGEVPVIHNRLEIRKDFAGRKVELGQDSRCHNVSWVKSERCTIPACRQTEHTDNLFIRIH